MKKHKHIQHIQNHVFIKQLLDPLWPIHNRNKIGYIENKALIRDYKYENVETYLKKNTAR